MHDAMILFMYILKDVLEEQKNRVIISPSLTIQCLTIEHDRFYFDDSFQGPLLGNKNTHQYTGKVLMVNCVYKQVSCNQGFCKQDSQR